MYHDFAPTIRIRELIKQVIFIEALTYKFANHEINGSEQPLEIVTHISIRI